MNTDQVLFYKCLGTLDKNLGDHIHYCIEWNKVTEKLIDCVNNLLPETVQYLFETVEQKYKENKFEVTSADFEVCYKNLEKILTLTMPVLKRKIYEQFNNRAKYMNFMDDFVTKVDITPKQVVDICNILTRNETRCYVSILSYYIKNRSDAKAFNIISKKFENKPIKTVMADIADTLDDNTRFFSPTTVESYYIQALMDNLIANPIFKR
ncbi:Uncharacterised protein [Candidatus Tiddalikarchaeum anstoanum]|nr:Uncharacterised protein [Candidatus Tiddalikarchaeum anstoanum]